MKLKESTDTNQLAKFGILIYGFFVICCVYKMAWTYPDMTATQVFLENWEIIRWIIPLSMLYGWLDA